jgi:hypothetical protein
MQAAPPWPAVAARHPWLGDGALEVHRRQLAHLDRGRGDGATHGAIAIVTARARVARLLWLKRR